MLLERHLLMDFWAQQDTQRIHIQHLVSSEQKMTSIVCQHVERLSKEASSQKKLVHFTS